MLGGDCQAKGPGGARPGERCRKSAPDRVDPSPRVLTPSWLTSACQVYRSAGGSLAGGRLRCGARCDSGTPRPRREPLPTWESPELLAVLSSATWWSLWNCMVLSGSLKLLPRQPRPPSSSSPAARGSPPTPLRVKPQPLATCLFALTTTRRAAHPSRTHEDSSSGDRLCLSKIVPAHSQC